MISTIVLAASLLATQDSAADERAIRAARDRFNAAIRAHDSTAIDAVWTDDFQSLSSRGKASSGRAANRAVFVTMFAERPDVVYVRTPDSIRVMTGWGTAAEVGHWQGHWSAPGAAIAVSGRYLAQWRRVGAEWRLASEYFVAVDCRGGAYCER